MRNDLNARAGAQQMDGWLYVRAATMETREMCWLPCTSIIINTMRAELLFA